MKKIILLLSMMILILGSYAYTNSYESCFLDIDIQELKIAEDVIDFSLINTDTIYGYYDGLVPLEATDQSDYILNTFNAGEIIGSYSISSSRYTYTDNFGDNPDSLGGVIEEDLGIISVVIPYSENIDKVTINNGDITDLDIVFSTLSCEKNCKDENEQGLYTQDKCCLGYTRIEYDETTFTCLDCGNYICGLGETYQKCPQDCTPEGNDVEPPDDVYNPLAGESFNIKDLLQGQYELIRVIDGTRYSNFFTLPASASQLVIDVDESQIVITFYSAGDASESFEVGSHEFNVNVQGSEKIYLLKIK